ncbi:MAG: Flp pilus assembly complex ATPase component, partial [Gammaproteobacteria bacterium]|nr:Flp pilus assembly complex ATPase component [Gammaproteobacteria bacterium]
MDFNGILKLMSEKKASDLFITVGMPPSIKVHGRISPISKSRLDEEHTRELVLGLMSPAQRDEFTNTNECNFAISAKGVGRFRVSAFIQRDSVGMVLRRIENVIPTMEQLLLPPILKDLAMTKRGLVMFVGATGTGKSTSLAGMLEYRNGNSSGHIVTVEDPIEFTHNHAGCIVTQREVGLDTESYEVALKNTLRQAPD